MSRSRLPAVLVALTLLAAGCTSVGGTPVGPETGAVDAGTLQPLGQALPVTVHKAVVRPGVVRVPAQEVKQVTPDGKFFVLTTQGASGLAAGSVMVIDGIAARKVIAVAPDGGGAKVETTQATTDEIFSDLDVSFDGTPDPSKVVFGPPAESDGPAATIETIAPDEQSGAPTSTGPSRLRGPGAALAPSGDGQITVIKQVAGDTGAAAGKTFSLTVDCSTDGAAAAGFPVTLSFPGAGSQRIPAPVGSTCSVSESDPQGALPTISDPVTIAAPAGDYRLTVTNTFGGGGGPAQPGNPPNQPGEQPGDQPGNQPGDQPNQPGQQDQPGDQPGAGPNNAPGGPTTRTTPPKTSRKPTPTPPTPPATPTQPTTGTTTPACPSNTISFSVPVAGFSIAASVGRNAQCNGYTFSADISGKGGPVSTSIGLQADYRTPVIKGRITAGESGTSQSTSVTLDGTIKVTGGAGAANPGGYQARMKLGWDIIKEDFPFTVAGVPFLVRFGVPLIIEFRLSGQHDTVRASFVSATCHGTIALPNLSAVDKSVCSMDPASVDSFLTLAPSAMVIAVGAKVGVGPGVSVPLSLPVRNEEGNRLPTPQTKSVVFAGITGTVAISVGLTTTGATSIGIQDCLRTDRVVQLVGSADASLGPVSASISHTFWQKTATNYSGPRCPPGS